MTSFLPPDALLKPGATFTVISMHLHAAMASHFVRYMKQRPMRLRMRHSIRAKRGSGLRGRSVGMSVGVPRVSVQFCLLSIERAEEYVPEVGVPHYHRRGLCDDRHKANDDSVRFDTPVWPVSTNGTLSCHVSDDAAEQSVPAIRSIAGPEEFERIGAALLQSAR
jgi:hypothetical protein